MKLLTVSFRMCGEPGGRVKTIVNAIIYKCSRGHGECKIESKVNANMLHMFRMFAGSR